MFDCAAAISREALKKSPVWIKASSLNAINFSMANRSLRRPVVNTRVSAPLAALIYTSEPLWGASLAWIVLGERWGLQGWVGAAIILSSSLFAQLSKDSNSSKLPELDSEGRPVDVHSD